MAATVTVAPGKSKYGREYTVYTVNWTSDGSGDASVTIDDLTGFLVRSVTDPVDGPTDNYDITLVQNSVDQLGGALLDRDTTNSEVVVHSDPIFLAGTHVFTVAAAGATKSGIAYLYVVQSL